MKIDWEAHIVSTVASIWFGLWEESMQAGLFMYFLLLDGLYITRKL